MGNRFAVQNKEKNDNDKRGNPHLPRKMLMQLIREYFVSRWAFPPSALAATVFYLRVLECGVDLAHLGAGPRSFFGWEGATGCVPGRPGKGEKGKQFPGYLT